MSQRFDVGPDAHLEAALAESDNAEARFHIRQAIQHLIAEADDE